MLALFKNYRDNDLILKNFYGMPPPSKEEIKKRAAKISKVIQQMGDKYCLYKSIPKKESK